MVDQNSPVQSAKKSGLAALTGVSTPPTPSPSRASRIAKWRFLLNEGISRLDDIPCSRITNVKLWLELVKQLEEMPEDGAAEVIDFWRALVASRKNDFISTAESCMIDALRALHDKISPMAVGVSEYDEIMSAQDILDGK
jgi:hypothetical protein